MERETDECFNDCIGTLLYAKLGAKGYYLYQDHQCENIIKKFHEQIGDIEHNQQNCDKIVMDFKNNVEGHDALKTCLFHITLNEN